MIKLINDIQVGYPPSVSIHKRNLYLSNQDILVGITEDTDKNSSYDSTITSMYVEYIWWLSGQRDGLWSNC